LLFDSSGSSNAAFGFQALNQNSAGSTNVAVGAMSLWNNTGGSSNVSVGTNSMYGNQNGTQNVAVGASALSGNVSGTGNTAVGMSALTNATGQDNIAIGASAGASATSGSHNIYIGNSGVAAESNAIRIGTVGTQNQAYIAGVIHGDGGGLTNLPISGVPDLLRLHLITYLGGCDSCSILTTSDNQKLIYQNLLGATLTLLSITCYSDTGTPSINIERDSGGTLAYVTSSAIACSTSPTAVTSFSVGTLNANDKVNFVMTSPGGAAHRVTVIIKTTL
jgi:hypothetical protein